MRPLFTFLFLVIVTSTLVSQNSGMQAAQTAQVATQTASQNAQRAAEQANRDAQNAGQMQQTAQIAASSTRCFAAKPSFSVKPGTYSSPVTVAIHLRGEKAAYYTTNGERPTKSSTMYTGPITIDKTTTLRAVTVSQCGQTGRIKSAKYTLKTAQQP